MVGLRHQVRANSRETESRIDRRAIEALIAIHDARLPPWDPTDQFDPLVSPVAAIESKHPE